MGGDLHAYISELRRLPRPTAVQIGNFVAYMAEAHSWYRDLPLLLPGTRFYVFLDPAAGAIDYAKSVRARFRVESVEEWHARFGHVAYVWEGHPFLDPSSFPPNEGHPLSIPEVVAAGCVHLTKVVHPLSARLWLWRHITRERLLKATWPAETGGHEVLEQIIALRKISTRYGALSSAPSKMRDFLLQGSALDEALGQLIAPERCRQHSEIACAVERVARLVYEAD